MFTVRHAGGEELPVVLAVWAEADAEPTITDDVEALASLLRHAPDSLLVAVDDGGRVVGTLIVAWDGWRGSFYRVGVLPALRRRGIARQLVATGEAQLIQSGARWLAVFAVTGDPGAIPFWQAVGYQAQSDRQRLVKNIATSR